MAKKQTIDLKLIEHDIINSLKYFPEQTEDAYRKWGVDAIIVACVLCIAGTFYLEIELYGILIIVSLGLLWGVAEILLHYRKRKKFSIGDYEVTTALVHSTAEEHYVATRGRYGRSRPVDIYDLRFENGKVWRIPKDNYTWSAERKMSDWYIYENAHRGDLFYVVVNKHTGDIAMAYDTEFFEYKA